VTLFHLPGGKEVIFSGSIVLSPYGYLTKKNLARP
jgi:hypothetical protein